MKRFLCVTIVAISFFLTSCNLFNNDITDYFDTYLNSTRIDSYEFDTVYSIINDLPHITSSDNLVLKFTLVNPKNYTLDVTITGLPSAIINHDYTLVQSSDKKTLTVTLNQAYLKTLENKTVNVTIYISDTESKRKFESYDFSFVVTATSTIPPTTPPTTYTVTFEKSHADATGVMPSQTFTEGIAQSLTPNSFTRTGYNFSHWNTQAEGLGTSYSDGANFTATDNTILYAIWKSKPKTTTPTITFNDSGNNIRISADSGATIYYTTDGSVPTSSSIKYTGEFTLTENKTIKAIATKTGYLDSDVTSKDFIYTVTVDSASTGSTGTEKITNAISSLSVGSGVIIVSGNIVETSLAFDEDENIELKGDSTNSGKLTAKSGSPIFAITKGTVTLGENLTLQGVSDNTESLVTIDNSGTFVLDGGTITGNTLTLDEWGGGGAGVNQDGGTFIMNSGTIFNNELKQGSGGAGVYQNGGTFTMQGGSISDNVDSGTGYGGGGVYVTAMGTSFIMEGGKITGNSTEKSGGGVHVYAYGQFILKKGEILNNTAKNGGGGLYLASGENEVSGGSITGNTAKNYGGGIYVNSYQSKLFLSGNPKVIDNKTDTETKNNIDFSYDTIDKGLFIQDSLEDGASIGLSPTSIEDRKAVVKSHNNYDATAQDAAKFSLDTLTGYNLVPGTGTDKGVFAEAITP